MNRHTKQVIAQGEPIAEAKKVMILIHGRGSSAIDILHLTPYFQVANFAFLAPQASSNTWYPHSFLASISMNEPSLSNGLAVLKELLDEVLAAGKKTQDLYWLGFSQGACLTAEFVARYAHEYAGVFILSGGLIGDTIHRNNYNGNFQNTPVFFGCSNVDPHIPLSRVQDSAMIFEEMDAKVTTQIYENAPHAVLEAEIKSINSMLNDQQRI